MIMARNEPSKIGYLRFLKMFECKVTTKESKIRFGGPFLHKKYTYVLSWPATCMTLLRHEDTSENSGPVNKL